MWTEILAFFSIIIAIRCETGMKPTWAMVNEPPVTNMDQPKIDNSPGLKIVYGDEDLTVLNEVVSDMEKSDILKSKSSYKDDLQPLPEKDVKCLMSVDRYCSKEMGQIKSLLIEAVREDCAKCTDTQKDAAGRVIASMMANDPVAWKLFLTRSALQTKPAQKAQKQEYYRYKIVGEPEEIENSRNRVAYPGVKVRVKRYKMDKLL